jgi:hypothetical protein
MTASPLVVLFGRNYFKPGTRCVQKVRCTVEDMALLISVLLLFVVVHISLFFLPFIPFASFLSAVYNYIGCTHAIMVPFHSHFLSDVSLFVPFVSFL